MHSLPIFVRLQGRPVILVGAGEAAEAKRRLLERAGALVLPEEAEARLAIVVDDDYAVARLKARGVLVNAVDRAELCDFTLPAIVDRDPVIVAVGTGGASAGLAAALRQRLEAILPAGLGRLADALFAGREAWRARYPDAGDRRRAISAALAPGGVLDPLDERSADLAERSESLPSPASAEDRKSGRPASPGRAQLVLTSPDPDDLTLRQARLLANADRVTHGSDVPRAVLDRARADATRIETPAPPADSGAPGLNVDVRMG